MPQRIYRVPSNQALSRFFGLGERPAQPGILEDVLLPVTPGWHPSDLFTTGPLIFQADRPMWTAQFALGVAGVNTVTTPPVPADSYWLVQALGLSHSDVAARDLWIEMISSAPTSITVPVTSVLVAVGGQRPVARVGNLYLGPGWVLQGRANTIAAGFQLTLSWSVIQLPLGLHAWI